MQQSPVIDYHTDASAKEPSSPYKAAQTQHQPDAAASTGNLEHSKRALHATYVLRRAEAIEETGTTRHLEDEDDGWKEVVRRCATAAASVQANAELKLRAYELRVSYLEEQLALEQAENSRLIVSNETLRKQLHENQATMMSPERGDDRTLTAEHHLNQLVSTRNQAVKEAAALKRNFLQHACEECRMNLKNKAEAEQTTSTGTPNSARRPTYQSSARQVLENLPKHSSPSRSPLKDAKKRKSTLDTGAENSDSNDVDAVSETATALIPGKTPVAGESGGCTAPLGPPVAAAKQKIDFRSHAYVGTYGRGPFRFGR